MRLHRRDKLDIMKDILTLCLGQDMRKTQITYKSNLNFQKASEFVEWLKFHSLVMEANKGVYKTTPDGERLLHTLEKLTAASNESEKK
ncbi:MAG: winged helix-turn-helix domain-containing protein [Methanothrix sp.]|nr:winged helix-turn-helix domain-containing protein [Methanothrix sp.]